MPNRTQSTAVAPELSRLQFGRHVRRALADLHDLAALRGNPLAATFSNERGDHATALRESLVKTIEALEPEPQVHANAKVWRRYRVLQLRYLQALPAVEVERALSISTSQYYREHEAALDALVTLLFEQASTRASAALEADVEEPPTARGQQHNLPAQITSFIGREQEIAEICTLLSSGRLVTLTGAGGCGKTRLALEVAVQQVEHFTDGVWLVDLTALAEPSLVIQTLAHTLGVYEGSGEPILSTLIRAIQSKDLLLVLDNCEHLLQACGQVVDSLLRACPHLRIMVTSREIVGITGEIVFQVAPLELPDPAQTASTGELPQNPAVKLFAERASAVSTRFALTEENTDAVVQICSRLDGLPLAIELAAARMNVFTASEIAQRLDDRFHLLTVGSRTAPLHHQTLHALIDWSFELLSENERRLFARLSVFAGGWTFEAAEIVCAGDGLDRSSVGVLLTALVERSLVLAEPTDDAMRYRMLETLREYAAERLSTSDNRTLPRVRHSTYYANLAEELETAVYGPRQMTALRKFEIEHNNFRAVLSAGSRGGDAAVHSARVAASLALFWFLRNYFTEARHWCDWVLSLGGNAEHPSFTRCLSLAGFFAASMGEHVAGLDMCDRAVARAKREGDTRLLAWTYFFRCGAAFVTGDAVTTERDARHGIQACSDAGWSWGAALCSAWLGRSSLMQRNAPHAVAQLRQALDRSRSVGDPVSAALSLSFYGAAVGAEGDYDTAAACLRQALDLFATIGECYAQMSRVLVDWSVLALSNGNIEHASTALAEALSMTDKLGRVPYRLAQILAGSAQVAAATQRWSDATRLLAYAQELRARSGTHLPPERAHDEALLQRVLERQLGESEFLGVRNGVQLLDEASALSLAHDVLRTATPARAHSFD